LNPIKPTRVALAVVTALTLTGCSSLTPAPLTKDLLAQQGSLDKSVALVEVEPLAGELTLEQAQARALKYNLDRRAKMMEEALALKQFDISRYDLLPKLLTQAGYTSRNNDPINQSRNSDTGQPSPSRFISQERNHIVGGLDLSWNLLDLGVGYYNTKQQANRALIAAEKRRKAMHLLMQDVRTAFWRAASAQKLQGEVTAAIATAEAALADSRKVEAERLRNPVDALRYQRQLLENLRLLEAIDQELSIAHVELASLINAPVGQPIKLQEPPMSVDRSVLDIPVETMEETAMVANADVREQHYNARIARDETRKTLVRLFPGLNFSYGPKYDTDDFLVNNNWREASLSLSYNLINLVTGPSQMKLAEAGVSLADQRRVAMQMAVVAQVHLGRLQLINTLKQFDRADAIWNTDKRIAEHVRNRDAARTQSKLDLVANQTSAILSLLRRYQALAQAQGAEARLQATLGVEPEIASVSETSVDELAATLRNGDGWSRLVSPAVQADPAAQPGQLAVQY